MGSINYNNIKTKILISLAILLVIVASIFIFSYNLSKEISSTNEEDKLQVSNPIYIDFEQIKTSGMDISKNSEYKYSQIEVKNISNETIYNISIELREQKYKEPNTSVIPSHHIEILKPGEVACLSIEHGNIIDDNPLEISEYTYNDIDGNSFTVNSILRNDNKALVSAEPEEWNKHKNITKEIDKIKIENIKTVNNDKSQYLEADIKNISDDNIENIGIKFIEYYDDKIIGNIYESIDELKSKQTKKIRINYKEDVELKIMGYAYYLYDKENEIDNIYDVYIDENSYTHYTYEYDTHKIMLRNIILKVTIFSIVVLIFNIYKKLKKRKTPINKKYK